MGGLIAPPRVTGPSHTGQGRGGRAAAGRAFADTTLLTEDCAGGHSKARARTGRSRAASRSIIGVRRNRRAAPFGSAAP